MLTQSCLRMYIVTFITNKKSRSEQYNYALDVVYHTNFIYKQRLKRSRHMVPPLTLSTRTAHIASVGAPFSPWHRSAPPSARACANARDETATRMAISIEGKLYLLHPSRLQPH